MGSHTLVNGVSKASELLTNDATKSWTVQKFGGTGVGKFAQEIAEQVVKWGTAVLIGTER